MSWYLMEGALVEGFIYAFVALGLFVSYRILNIADLTTDGSFALGSVLAAVITNQGYPILALIAALLAGGIAGSITAFLQTKAKVPEILSGIITMTALYSINLMIMGGAPNLFFSKKETIFTLASNVFPGSYSKLITLMLIVFVISLLMLIFFNTQLGMCIRATGDNPEMVKASSINPALSTTIGLCLSNGLISFAGGLLAQSTTQGDVNIGTGTVVIGLASLILGGVIFRKRTILFGLLAAIFGAVIYRFVLTIALRSTNNAGYLKLVSAVLVAIVISYPTAQQFIKEKIRRHQEVNKNAKLDES